MNSQATFLFVQLTKLWRHTELTHHTRGSAPCFVRLAFSVLEDPCVFPVLRRTLFISAKIVQLGASGRKLVLIAFLLRSFQPCSWFFSLLFLMLCFVFVLLVVPHGKNSPFHRQGKKSLLPQFLTVYE